MGLKLQGQIGSYIKLVGRREVKNLLQKCVNMGMSAYPLIKDEYYILTHKSNVEVLKNGEVSFYNGIFMSEDDCNTLEKVRKLLYEHRKVYSKGYRTLCEFKEDNPNVKKLINLSTETVSTSIIEMFDSNMFFYYKQAEQDNKYLKVILEHFNEPFKSSEDVKAKINIQDDSTAITFTDETGKAYSVKDIDVTKLNREFLYDSIETYETNFLRFIELLKKRNVVHFYTNDFITIDGKAFKLGFNIGGVYHKSSLNIRLHNMRLYNDIYDVIKAESSDSHEAIEYKFGEVFVKTGQTEMPDTLEVMDTDLGLYIGRCGNVINAIAKKFNKKFMTVKTTV